MYFIIKKSGDYLVFIIQFFEGIDALDSLNMDLFDFPGVIIKEKTDCVSCCSHYFALYFWMH